MFRDGGGFSYWIGVSAASSGSMYIIEVYY